MIFEAVYVLLFTFTKEQNRTLAVNFSSLSSMRSYYCRILVPDKRPRVVEAFRFETKNGIRFYGHVSGFAYTDCRRYDPTKDEFDYQYESGMHEERRH